MPAHAHHGGTADLWSSDRSSNSILCFINAKQCWKFWGLPPTSYNKASSPDSFPLWHTQQRESCKCQTGRERTAPALEIRQGHVAMPPRMCLPPAKHSTQHPGCKPPQAKPGGRQHLEHASSCILPGPMHLIQNDGAGVQRAKHMGERGRSMTGAWLAATLLRTREKTG